MSHKLKIEPYIIKFCPHNPIVNETVTIYGFDLDHTIIKPKTPNAIHSRSADDWQFMEFNEGKSTVNRLIELAIQDPDAQFVIFTNQGGIVAVPPNSKSCTKFVNKIQNILKYIQSLKDGDFLLNRLWIFGSPKKPASLFPNKKKNGKKQQTLGAIAKPVNNKIKSNSSNLLLTPELFDRMRKPNIGMYDTFVTDIEKVRDDIKIEWKYYCGDAGGRKTDFSDSDKQFASNLEVEFRLPEDIFI